MTKDFPVVQFKPATVDDFRTSLYGLSSLGLPGQERISLVYNGTEYEPLLVSKSQHPILKGIYDRVRRKPKNLRYRYVATYMDNFIRTNIHLLDNQMTPNDRNALLHQRSHFLKNQEMVKTIDEFISDEDARVTAEQKKAYSDAIQKATTDAAQILGDAKTTAEEIKKQAALDGKALIAEKLATRQEKEKSMLATLSQRKQKREESVSHGSVLFTPDINFYRQGIGINLANSELVVFPNEKTLPGISLETDLIFDMVNDILHSKAVRLLEFKKIACFVENMKNLSNVMKTHFVLGDFLANCMFSYAQHHKLFNDLMAVDENYIPLPFLRKAEEKHLKEAIQTVIKFKPTILLHPAVADWLVTLRVDQLREAGLVPVNVTHSAGTRMYVIHESLLNFSTELKAAKETQEGAIQWDAGTYDIAALEKVIKWFHIKKEEEGKWFHKKTIELTEKNVDTIFNISTSYGITSLAAECEDMILKNNMNKDGIGAIHEYVNKKMGIRDPDILKLINDNRLDLITEMKLHSPSSADLAYIRKHFPQLVKLEVEGISYESLEALKGLKLTKLRLHGCGSDFAKLNLAPFVPELDELHLSNVGLTEENLPYISKFKVRSLIISEIWDCPKTGLDLKHFSSLPQLEALSLSGQSYHLLIKEGTFKELASLKNLRKLRLPKTSFTDQDMMALSSQLTVLDLSHCKVTSTIFERICTMSGLQILNLSHTNVNDDGLKSISNKLPNLQELDLSGCKNINGSQILNYVAQCRELRKLILAECGVSGWEWQNLEALNQLQELDFSSGAMNDHDLHQLTTVCASRLRRLILANNRGITDAGCRKLSACKQLQELDLSGSQVTGEGIRSLPELRTLLLKNCHNIQDLTLLDELPRLSHVDLSECNKLDVESIMGLVKKFTQLEILGLSGCKNINDDCLHVLLELTQLRKLYLSKCNNITKKFVPDLLKLTFLSHLDLECHELTGEYMDTLTFPHGLKVNRNYKSRI